MVQDYVEGCSYTWFAFWSIKPIKVTAISCGWPGLVFRPDDDAVVIRPSSLANMQKAQIAKLTPDQPSSVCAIDSGITEVKGQGYSSVR